MTSYCVSGTANVSEGPAVFIVRVETSTNTDHINEVKIPKPQNVKKKWFVYLCETNRRPDE
jgi:hypothetical protein